MNLIDNSLFWLSDQPQSRRVILDEVDGAMVISDSGPGIQERDWESIFEFGFTRKPTGRGLGLYISREVFRRVGYTIDIHPGGPLKWCLFSYPQCEGRPRLMNDQSSRTLMDFSVQNVSNFLQTVVVMDDKARFKLPPPDNDNNSTSRVSEGDNEGPIGAHANLISPQPDTADPLVDPEDLDAKALVDGFAKEGIACTILQPDSDDNVITQVTKVAEMADIVVLDWILDKDNGKRTTSLIRKLIREEGGSDRIRLIAIYTGERDLGDVADRVYQVLSTSSGEVPDRLSDFVAVKGPVRIAYSGRNTRQCLPKTHVSLIG